MPTTEYDGIVFENSDYKPLRGKLLDPVVKPVEEKEEERVLKPVNEELNEPSEEE